MHLTQKVAVGAAALAGTLGFGGLGLVAAFAGSPAASAATPPAATLTVATNPVTAGNPEAGGNAEHATEADGPGGHQDPPGANVQYGSQSGPDTGGAAGN